MSGIDQNAISLGPANRSAASSATAQTNTNLTYIQQIRDLQHAYPALKHLLANLEGRKDQGRVLVEEYYAKQCDRSLPGRCTLLLFEEQKVEAVAFLKPDELDAYLQANPAGRTNPQCRLWVLEDLHVEWIDVLGKHLGVNPTIFSEQIQTWNFTDSDSVPSRSLPSMVQAQKAFTLRYYEVRRLTQGNSVKTMTNQMTFAANRRRYERWRDVDTNSRQKMDATRHGLVRRCASFWTDQRAGQAGWNAVMLVDPAFDCCKWGGNGGQAACIILKNPHVHADWPSLWKARAWDTQGSVKPLPDTSVPYHEGPSTLADASLSSGDDIARYATLLGQNERNRSSPLDEMIFYWTKLADEELIHAARKTSINSAYYLLKNITTCWNDQLELIACGVAQSEYFADDHQASIQAERTGQDWRDELTQIDQTTQDINYQKRQLSYYEQALTLNLERLGIIIGQEEIDKSAPRAIREAQMDFLNIRNRLLPFIERVASLGNVANDLANLHTAYRSIKSGEYGLRLSLLASIVFPMTLVTSMLSMGDDYLPGKRDFWVFWAASVPLVCLLATMLVLGRRPQRQISDFIEAKMREKRKSAAQGRSSA